MMTAVVRDCVHGVLVRVLPANGVKNALISKPGGERGGGLSFISPVALKQTAIVMYVGGILAKKKQNMGIDDSPDMHLVPKGQMLNT